MLSGAAGAYECSLHKCESTVQTSAHALRHSRLLLAMTEAYALEGNWVSSIYGRSEDAQMPRREGLKTQANG